MRERKSWRGIGAGSAGSDSARRWLLVRYGGNDVGCLYWSSILRTNCGKLFTWELCGGPRPWIWIGDHTPCWTVASRSGGERVVLAVDAANEPAVKAYAAAGFATWVRRGVLLKILT